MESINLETKNIYHMRYGIWNRKQKPVSKTLDLYDYCENNPLRIISLFEIDGTCAVSLLRRLPKYKAFIKAQFCKMFLKMNVLYIQWFQIDASSIIYATLENRNIL